MGNVRLMPFTDFLNPDVLLRENWENQVRLSADGTPHLPPSFVAEAGTRVWVIDVRNDEALTGPQGHIPGVLHNPLARIGQVAELLPGNTPVILVDDDGVRSRIAARLLIEVGMTTVAAMDGGMELWRSEGYFASRDPSTVERTVKAPAPGHGSDGRLLDRRKGTKHLTREMVLEQVGDHSKVGFQKLASVVMASQTSCVDGREDRAIIGTPGGDSGEWLLGLAAAEKVGGARLDLRHVPALVRSFADTFGGMYLHTDSHALNRLVRSIRSDNRIEPAVANLGTIREWERFLRSPPPSLHKLLLEHLFQPDHIGCGHIKLALKNPDVYGIRTEMITAFFAAFYENLWQGARDFHWFVLGGDHAEGAVINVTLDEPLGPFSAVPLIAPSIGGVQAFVNHPQVVAYVRSQIARFLTTSVESMVPVSGRDADILEGTIGELGGAQAMATLKALAGGLPVFDVHFDVRGSFEVTQADAIPVA